MSSDAGLIDLTPMLGPERQALLDLLRGLPAEDWELPTECPEWTVRGLALHVLGDDLSLLTRQRDGGANGLILYGQGHPGLGFRALLDGFNEQWVHAATFLSVPLHLELLALVGTWSADFYTAVGLEEISREPVGIFAAEGLSPYWQVIAREYLERFIHQSQLRRAVGAPELDGPLVTSAARVVVHAVAAWLRDYDAAGGSTIEIGFGGHGAWTLQRTPDHWAAHDGAQRTPTARVVVPWELTVAVLSRGVSTEELAAATTIEGDQALAAGALAIVAPFVAHPPD